MKADAKLCSSRLQPDVLFAAAETQANPLIGWNWRSWASRNGMFNANERILSRNKRRHTEYANSQMFS